MGQQLNFELNKGKTQINISKHSERIRLDLIEVLPGSTITNEGIETVNAGNIVGVDLDVITIDTLIKALNHAKELDGCSGYLSFRCE